MALDSYSVAVPGASTPTTIYVAGSPDGDDSNPLVILLHGTSGKLADMSDPATHPGWNYDVHRPLDKTPQDRGESSYPPHLIWDVDLDPTVKVTGWQPYLTSLGVPSLNYQQVAPRLQIGGASGAPVLELQAIVLDAIARWPTRRIVFLTHSRGGILLRQWLVVHGQDAEIQKRLCAALLLHAPNQGSQIANFAVDVTAWIEEVKAGMLDDQSLPSPLKKAASWVEKKLATKLAGPLAALEDAADGQAFLDYEVGSAVLASIAALEPVPGISMFTFGGTSTKITRVIYHVFTLDSYLPSSIDWSGIEWEWNTVEDAIWPEWIFDDDIAADLIGSLEGGDVSIPELKDGSGDCCVADASAKLPFLTADRHTSNAINHMQALWDPGLQAQVSDILVGRCPQLVPSLVVTVTPFGAPLGTPVVLQFTVTDSITGKTVEAAVQIEDPKTVGTSPAVGPVTFDGDALYVTAHPTTTRGRPDAGGVEMVCTSYTPSHYPVATVSAPGYASVAVALGPDATDVELKPSPDCYPIVFQAARGPRAAFLEWLLVHGGDPMPLQAPVEGIEPDVWAIVRASVGDWQAASARTVASLTERGHTVRAVKGRLLRSP